MKRWRELFTLLNLHFVLLGLVIVLDIFVAVRFAMAWSAIRSDQSTAFAQEEIRYGQLSGQMKHLNGLPRKVQQADTDAQKFFAERMAPNYSTLVTQLDSTASKDQVRLARSSYGQQPAIDGLTEVRVDAGLSGEYTALMHFINDLERDKDHVFFIIDAVQLTGQQGGLVNLRLRMTTYIRSNADMPPAPAGTAGMRPAAVEGAR